MNTPKPRFVETPAIKARRAMDRIVSSKNDLGILEAALVMSIEGMARATASEVADRAARQFETTSTASEVGLLLRGLGIGTATSHGKSRLILDGEQLKSLRDRLAMACQDASAELEGVLKDFEDIAVRVKTLDQELTEALHLRARERELAGQIQQIKATPSQLPYLEQEAARLRNEAARADEMEKQNKDLAAKIEDRNAAQQTSLKQYDEESQKVAAAEARLGQALEELKKRSAWVTFLDLDRNIRNQKAEIEDLSRQVAEKRSLFQRVFGSNKGR